jgi:hypothetical protein
MKEQLSIFKDNRVVVHPPASPATDVAERHQVVSDDLRATEQR